MLSPIQIQKKSKKKYAEELLSKQNALLYYLSGNSKSTLFIDQLLNIKNHEIQTRDYL